VVGWSSRSAASKIDGPWWDTMRAFYWDGETIYDLNDLIDTSDPLYGKVTLSNASAINDSGQILATGYVGDLDQFNEPDEFLYLLSPVHTN
jgi:uncharacterized membrane protein